MTKITKCPTLCGTCKWWDHEEAERRDATDKAERARIKKSLGIATRPFSWSRIATCLWGIDLKLPEWCGGLQGMRQTNEAGTTAIGCKAWEQRP